MAGIDSKIDPRGAHWEDRLRRPVMAAALLALPTVLLYFSKLEGWVAILVATFPALTSILEGLLAARALSSLQATRVLQVLYLAKAGKLIKSALILRKDGSIVRHPVVSSVVVLVVAIVLVGIGHRVVSGEKHATPVHNAIDVVDGEDG